MKLYDNYLTVCNQNLFVLRQQQEACRNLFPPGYYSFIIKHLERSNEILRVHHELIQPIITEQLTGIVQESLPGI